MEWRVAIGVDTHGDEHVAVALDGQGARLDLRSFAAGSGGYLELLAWAGGLGGPAFAIEGAGSYGGGRARFLAAAGASVFACERPSRRDRRGGKSDRVDAAVAARRLLGDGAGLGQLRGGGKREGLRVLLVERRGASQARTDALNQLHALVVCAPPEVRERLRSLSNDRLASACARLRRRGGRATTEVAVLVDVLRRLGRRALTLGRALEENERELQGLVEQIAPELLAEVGVGPFSAAQLLVSGGDPTRMRSEASFAALAGTSPLEASSGPLKRHRLNRGGDRQLNRALHLIALARKRYHTETAAYYERLLAGGKTKREAMRCLKRMLARYFHRKLLELDRKLLALAALPPARPGQP